MKTTVYFDVRSFQNAKHKSLPSSGLRVGDSVIFDAKVGPKDFKAKFRARRVTRACMTKPSSSPCLSLPSMNDGRVGACDTITRLVNQEGAIEKVRSHFGIIKFGPNQEERTFFHANNVEESLGKPILKLQDVFKVEDKVRFDAKPSTKPSGKVKWEATAVYLCRSSDGNSITDLDDKFGNEVYLSDDEFDIEEFLLAKLDEYKSHETDFNESPAEYTDWDASSVKADTSNSPGKKNAKRLLPRWERRQKLSGEQGFFYPVTESSGTVKFGPGRGLTACAVVEVTYRDEELVENLLWELADGQEVSFDAVQADENTWIATLVWIGQRPAKPPVGNSEDVFNTISNKSRGAQKSLPNAEPRPRGDFSGDKILQNVGPRSQVCQPVETTPPSLGAHNELSACESAPGLPFPPAGVNDEVLVRLAQMVAAELTAKKARLRVGLREVGVQTVEEGPSPYSEPDGLVPALVSSSTQTFSTGGIQ